MHHPERSKRAFTLIELLVVIAIIGILSTLVVTQLGLARVKARNAQASSDIAEAGKAVETFKAHNDQGAVLAAVGSSLPGYFGLQPAPGTAYAAACTCQGDRLNYLYGDNFLSLFTGAISGNYYPMKLNHTPSQIHRYEYRTTTNLPLIGSAPNQYHDLSTNASYTLVVQLDNTDSSIKPFFWINNGFAGSGVETSIPAP